MSADTLHSAPNATSSYIMTYDEVGDAMASPAGEVIARVVVPIICAFGIVGIIVTVIVLSRKNMCTSTNCYLMALSITDLLFLILFASILAEDRFTAHTQPYYFYSMYITYAIYLIHVFLIASIWLTVMLAVERYIAICQPFLATKMCTVVKARVIVVLIYFCALCCRIPNLWENRIVTVFDHSTNNTIYYMESTEFAENIYYVTVYPWIVDVVLSSVIPFVLLLVLNVRLIWEVRKSTRYLQRNMMMSGGASGTGSNVAQREELQITVMLISVVIVFFVCQGPYVIYTAIRSTNMAFVSHALLLLRYVTILLLALKSAINFLLYCWFSEKFRATLRHVFCSRRCLQLIGQGEKNPNCNYYNMRRISNSNTRDTTI